jgi:DNA-binding transcriptional regulator YhcF (GntR family)
VRPSQKPTAPPFSVTVAGPSSRTGPCVTIVTALAAEHELSLVTVRRAMAVLKDEGLIETYPGRGTFVI